MVVTADGTARDVATRMAEAAAAWLGSLDATQRAVGTGGTPGSDAEADEERLRWYYTPTDHGGLTLGEMAPAQQSLAMQLVASGLSTAGYVTVSTILGLENVLDHVEGWGVDWGRERGRDPQRYYLRVFGEPGPSGAWAWRFGGHHGSLNNPGGDGAVRSTTPRLPGAAPASAGPLRRGTAQRPAREDERGCGEGQRLRRHRPRHPRAGGAAGGAGRGAGLGGA